MKKIIAAILTLALSLALLASCGVGPSVPYYILAMDNYSMNVFDDYDAYRETVTYYKNGEKDFEYSIYVDIGKDGYFNVCESYDGYTFYGFEENLYAVTGGKTYAVLQTNNRSYLDFIGDYNERAHPLDKGSKFQRNSIVTSYGTQVIYYASVTPLMAAELAGFGVTETDKIVSEYRLMENTTYYLGIEYSIERADGSTEKIAERNFEYFETVKADIFENVPDESETVNVKIIYESGKENTYKLPKGVYIGIDGEENVTYYADASFENAFDFENTQVLEPIKIYAKNN